MLLPGYLVRRTLICLALVALATLIFSVTAVAARRPIVSPTADPYYGYAGLQGTRGFGQVEPRTIYYAGGPTAMLCYIHWQSWGGPVARGTGVGFYISAKQVVGRGHPAEATVVASKLGRWKGRPAYNELTWSFPNRGDVRRPRLCL